jgi:hypothetical protein
MNHMFKQEPSLSAVFEWEQIGRPLFCMFVQTIVFLTLLYILETVRFKISTQSAPAVQGTIFTVNVHSQHLKGAVDDDILREEQRHVEILRFSSHVFFRMQNIDTIDEMIKVRECGKSYGSLVAVKKVSFGIKEGECFGLLGKHQHQIIDFISKQ